MGEHVQNIWRNFWENAQAVCSIVKAFNEQERRSRQVFRAYTDFFELEYEILLDWMPFTLFCPLL